MKNAGGSKIRVRMVHLVGYVGCKYLVRLVQCGGYSGTVRWCGAVVRLHHLLNSVKGGLLGTVHCSLLRYAWVDDTDSYIMLYLGRFA